MSSDISNVEFYNNYLLKRSMGIVSSGANVAFYDEHLIGKDKFSKHLLNEDVPSSLLDYSANVNYDISSVHYDTTWSDSVSTENNSIISFSPSLKNTGDQTNKSFGEIFPDSNIEMYKKVYLEPYRKITGTNNKVWAAYDADGNNLLEDAINYNFANDGSYLPILEYNTAPVSQSLSNPDFKQINMFTDPLFWLLDDVNGTVTFFNSDASLNAVNIQELGNVQVINKAPRLTFYRYVGDRGFDNLDMSGNIKVTGTLEVSDDVIIRDKLDVSGVDISNNLSVSGTVSGTTTTFTGTTHSFGSNSVVGTTVNIISNDTNVSTLNLIGNSQGGGNVFVGQGTAASNADYGGGMTYVGGDATDIAGQTSNHFCLYRRDNGTNTWTMRQPYNDSKWEFADDIQVNGNIGIGTTSPAAPLSVCRIQNDFNTTKVIGVHMGVYDDDSIHYPNIQFVSNSLHGSWIDFVHTTTGNSDFDGRIRYSHTDGFKFFTNNAQQMTIDTDGNVGIGTTSPGSKLDVNGSITSTGDINTAGVIQRQSHLSGYQVGSHNNVGSNNGKTNPIYVIGSNYKPTETSLSNMYGIGYTYGSTVGGAGSGQSSWGLYVAADGDCRVFLNGSNGNIIANGYIKSGYNTNTTSYFGRCAIGYNGTDSDYASFAHLDMNSPYNYALMQSSLGYTQLNAASGKVIYFRIANGTKMNLSATSLYPEASGYDLGTTGKRWEMYATSINANNKIDVQVASGDATAEVNIYGNGNSTGRLYVGQALNYGGGIEYNGDNSPATSGSGADYITLYRRDNGTNYWTARNKYNSHNWEFRGGLTCTSLTMSGTLSGATTIGCSTINAGTVNTTNLSASVKNGITLGNALIANYGQTSTNTSYATFSHTSSGNDTSYYSLMATKTTCYLNGHSNIYFRQANTYRMMLESTGLNPYSTSGFTLGTTSKRWALNSKTINASGKITCPSISMNSYYSLHHSASVYFNYDLADETDLTQWGGGYTNVSIYGPNYFTSGAGFISVSDKRVKYDIFDISKNYCLDVINSIEIKKYKYKNNRYDNEFEYGKSDDYTIGFIAQNVLKYLPQAVKKASNDMSITEINIKDIIISHEVIDKTLFIYTKILNDLSEKEQIITKNFNFEYVNVEYRLNEEDNELYVYLPLNDIYFNGEAIIKSIDINNNEEIMNIQAKNINNSNLEKIKEYRKYLIENGYISDLSGSEIYNDGIIVFKNINILNGEVYNLKDKNIYIKSAKSEDIIEKTYTVGFITEEIINDEKIYKIECLEEVDYDFKEILVIDKIKYRNILTLQKEVIFAVHHGAIQGNNKMITNNEKEIETLKTENESLKTEVASLKSTLDSVLTRLSALESSN